MGSLNKVMLIGNLGADPEMRQTQNGTAVASLSIATNEKWKDREGVQQERTEWHKVTCWDKLATLCEQYLSKGRSVYVEGRLQTRKWQDRDGNDRYTTEIVARDIVFLGGRGESNGASGGGGGHAPPPATDDDVPF